MANDKDWEYRSDEWVKALNASRLLKEQRLTKERADSEVKKYTIKNIERYPNRYCYVVKTPHSSISFNRRTLFSLRTWLNDFNELNHILGSLREGIIFPVAISNVRR
jgi:hypothetical protein